MEPAAPPAVIGPEHAALMRRRVSIIAATRDAQHRPHLMRALGCRLAADRRELTLFLSTSACAELLADLRDNGRIAVVFAEPSTDRSLQLKGEGACIEPPAPGDAALVAHYVECFADEIATLGFDRALVQTMFRHEPHELVTVRFVPREAYEQTPGPQAGARIAP